MIGEDDFASFFDPDEFGVRVVLVEPGQDPRKVDGMLGAPEVTGRVYRTGIDPGAAKTGVRLNRKHLQLPRNEAPASKVGVKVIIDQVEYSIGDIEPLGRLRALLTLIPWGERDQQPEERGKWRASN
ncbi:hypothetical protein [Pseudomonas juntendi]|uniref:hypothetical protein n=1 Tax=Pseudomonas juntendi TaxID=2666183 RepID=UPI00244CFBDE|nr:hypothetical protein [Pseudomonas juntendi]MDH1551003.1 hypothetical protein [Pseudomonas juntendi]